MRKARCWECGEYVEVDPACKEADPLIMCDPCIEELEATVDDACELYEETTR